MLTVFPKCSILHVRQGSQYVSGNCENSFITLIWKKNYPIFRRGRNRFRVLGMEKSNHIFMVCFFPWYRDKIKLCEPKDTYSDRLHCRCILMVNDIGKFSPVFMRLGVLIVIMFWSNALWCVKALKGRSKYNI